MWFFFLLFVLFCFNMRNEEAQVLKSMYLIFG